MHVETEPVESSRNSPTPTSPSQRAKQPSGAGEAGEGAGRSGKERGEQDPAPCIVWEATDCAPISPLAVTTEPNPATSPAEIRRPEIGRPSPPYSPDRARMARRVSQRITGSRRFYDLLTTLYPDARDPAIARVFLALLSPHHVGKAADGEPEVLLDGPTLAACMGRERDYAEGNLRRYYVSRELVSDQTTGAFLQAFCDITRLPLKWSEYGEGRTRAAKLSHVRAILHPLLLTAWEREMQTDPRHAEERVYLDTGTAFNAVSRSRERKRIEKQMEGYADHAPTPLTGRLYRLMSTVPARAFSPLMGRIEAARTVARGLESEKTRADAEGALNRIAYDPVQRYGFSPYSARLFGTNAGVATITTIIRHVLLSDCVEYDLAASQLAIGAAEWGCPLLFDFLASGEPFWPEIVAYVGLPYSAEAKAAVKKGVYPSEYGASGRRIVASIREEYARRTGAALPVATAERFLTHPLIAELLAARDAELAAIRERGYVVDCFGRTLVKGQVEFGDGSKRVVSGPNAKRSLLAQKAQARELWLLEPLIELAEAEARKGKGAEWRILCWQHDGCSIHFRRRRESHEARIMAAVQDRADRYGYPTQLEVKYTSPVSGLAGLHGIGSYA